MQKPDCMGLDEQGKVVADAPATKEMAANSWTALKGKLNLITRTFGSVWHWPVLEPALYKHYGIQFSQQPYERGALIPFI